MEQRTNQSEVARLLSLIETEYLAAQRGLTGFAEGARHAAITARMEQMGKLHENLRAIVGEDAMRLVAERLETTPIEEENQSLRIEEENRW